MADAPLSFQEIIFTLHRYWREKGCLSWHPHHESVGAGTGNPATLLRVLGKEPWNVAYVEPSFRPDDGRYGENPNRMQMHHQYQVILKPIPEQVQDLYLESLFALGLRREEHDIRFVEDNWESPALGAWGLGWEVWLDGMEISQYTYFQQAGGLALDPTACELTYGLERIAMYIQNVNSVWDLDWDGRHTYGDILKRQEIEFCIYDFEVADVERLRRLYTEFEEEAKACLTRELVAPAYDYVLRCSHTFNLLDARGAISVAERAQYFARMRHLTRECSKRFAAQREEMGFPLCRLMPAWTAPALPPAVAGPAEATTLLLEVGTEELPDGEVSRLADQLHEALRDALRDHRLAHGAIEVFATPRRLAVRVAALAPQQATLVEELKGPARAICEKNPKALEGFLRKAGAEAEAVVYREVAGQSYAFVTRAAPTRAASEVLAEILPNVVRRPVAGRSMRWLAPDRIGDTEAVEFSRPVRWLVALLGSTVLPFRWAGLVSGRTTHGGRWRGSPVLEIPHADAYETLLADQGVIALVAARRERVRNQVEAVGADLSGTVNANARLLDEVTQLVEGPTAFAGTFDPEFLSLPEPLLVGVMEKHQRYFAVRAPSGKLLPAFVGVRNGTSEHLDSVRRGNERVLRARLADAAFFYRKDRERTLEDFRADLARLTFQERLGSMLDKSERLRRLAKKMLGHGLLPDGLNAADLDRAATLSKADLATQMVTEMTSLQGVMGRYYALHSGESEAIAKALEEHYLPRQHGDALPATDLGCALSLIDRIDNLMGMFAVGVRPSGTGDPFGLRRDATGLLAILRHRGHRLSLVTAFRIAAEEMPIPVDSDSVGAAVEFVQRRLEAALREEGRGTDSVRAVLARCGEDPAKAVAAIEELEAHRAEDGFKSILEALSRISRIRAHAAEKGEPTDRTFSADLVRHDAETTLARAVEAATSKLAAESDPTLMSVLRSIGALVPAISVFFESVMVLDEDPGVRQNRLALLDRIEALVSPWMDVRQLEGA